jgi:hypothetical protein
LEKAAIEILMAHADEKTTNIYLKRCKTSPSSDFVTVEALHALAEMLAIQDK